MDKVLLVISQHTNLLHLLATIQRYVFVEQFVQHLFTRLCNLQIRKVP